MTNRWILGVILLALATPASADSCDTLAAAVIKEVHTAHRYDNKVMHDGRLELEMIEISVGGKKYIAMTGGLFSSAGWAVSAWDPDKDEANYRQASAKLQQTCHSDGTDSIDGEAMDIIAVVNSSGFTTRTWISHATGLPMKDEGQPEGGRTMLSIYSYNDITAPNTN